MMTRLLPILCVAWAIGAGSVGAGSVGGGAIGGVDTASAASVFDGMSIEVGRTLYGTDYAARADAPTGGALFSVWTRVPDSPPVGYPWTRGNMDSYTLYGADWSMRALVGNMIVDDVDNVHYNANVMIFANTPYTWVGDYAYYLSIPFIPVSQAFDWVWVAWYVDVNATDMDLYQWLQYGEGGSVFAAGESHPTFADMRTSLVGSGWTVPQAAAWVPGQPTHFQVGSDNGFLTHARMDAMASPPTLGQLQAIVDATAPSPSAWGDWPFVWSGGAANLDDYSGNNRDLSIETGGTLYQGPATP